MKYSVARQQCNGNPVVHFQGNNQRFILLKATSTFFLRFADRASQYNLSNWPSYKYVNNNTQETKYCFSVQQTLRESTTVLRHMHVAYLVYITVHLKYKSIHVCYSVTIIHCNLHQPLRTVWQITSGHIYLIGSFSFNNSQRTETLSE
jgi:hypothetical protein